MTKEKVQKSILAFGLGWLDFIDHIFFHLPFTGPVQADGVRTKNGIKKELWDQHHETVSADHRSPGAREDFRASWKKYIAKHVSAGVAPEVPMGGALMGDDD